MGSSERSMTDEAFKIYKDHFNAPRSNTDIVLSNCLRELHPEHHLTTVSEHSCDLLAYAEAGLAKADLEIGSDAYQAERVYYAAARRSDESPGKLSDQLSFAKFQYTWKDKSFLVYHAHIDDGISSRTHVQYILSRRARKDDDRLHSAATDELILAVAKWSNEIRDEIYVFDNGSWTKNKSLWKSVQQSSWDDVILDPKMKERLTDDIEGFFDRKSQYKDFAVPWKRGIIFHGVPGNGKTMCLTSIMHSLSVRPQPIPALYVKSLDHCRGERQAIRSIFHQARYMAPCLLIFEDIDSLVNDRVRSYFLNEVDGIESMDGIMMVGSTNHLDKLDPAISKRPSRFDRKYHFSLPGETERRAYCEYWREKLAKTSSVEFPSWLSDVVAKRSEGFSFAYLKELFLSSLLIAAGRQDQEDNDNTDEAREDAQEKSKTVNKDGVAADDVTDDEATTKLLSSFPLGRAIQSQIQTLREEMDTQPQTRPKVENETIIPVSQPGWVAFLDS